MKVKKISISINSNMEDLVSSIIFENNIVGVEIDDNINLSKEDLDKMYVDIPLQLKDDGKATIIFYIKIVDEIEYEKFKNLKKENEKVTKENVDLSYTDSFDNIFLQDEFDIIFENIKNKLNEINEFLDLGSLQYKIEDLPNENYNLKWQQYFKSINIDNIIVKPYWDNNKYENDIIINIEPGMAFGTGSHETTKLCIKSIKSIVEFYKKNNTNLSNIRFLDVGCGSGILGILATKLGIEDTTYIDIDKTVDENLNKNLDLNNIKTDKIFYGNIIDDDEFRLKIGYNNYNIIVANILSPVIINLVTIGSIDKFLIDDGYFLASGIIKQKLEDVKFAFEQNKNLKIINVLSEGDWCIIIAKKQK